MNKSLPRHYIGIYLLMVTIIALLLMGLSSCSKSGKRLPQQQQQKDIYTFYVVDTFTSYYQTDSSYRAFSYVDLMFLHEDGNSIRRIYWYALKTADQYAFFRFAYNHKGDTLRMHVP